MKSPIIKSLMLAFALAGCATIPKTEQVQIRAAHDLRCDADKVKTTTIDAKTIRASACGQEVVYVENCPFPEGTQATRCTWIAQDGAAAVQANAPANGMNGVSQ